MLAVNFRAMGCQMQALCQPKDDSNSDIMAMALADLSHQVGQAEQRFSRFLADSELMQLNQRRAMPVSGEFWQMLNHALASAKLTDGIVSPTLLQPLRQKGYARSFNQLSNRPSSQLLAKNTPLPSSVTTQPNTLSLTCDWRDIRLAPATQEVSLPKGLHLDLGGFAKGLTAWDCVKKLSANPYPILFDAGGDIVTQGMTDPNGVAESTTATAWQYWQVELPNIKDIGLPIEAINSQKNLPSLDLTTMLSDWQMIDCPLLESVSVNLCYHNAFTLATSGIDYRYWFQDGQLQHHLVHPYSQSGSDIVCASILIPHQHRFAHPAIQQFLQVSNITNLAQTLSKLFCLLGVAQSRLWQQRYGLEGIGISLLLLTQNTGKRVYQHWVNPALQSYIHLSEPI